MHRALVDGVSGLTLMRQPMTTGIEGAGCAPPGAGDAAHRHQATARPPATARACWDRFAGLAPSTFRLARSALIRQQLTLPSGGPAPCSMSPSGRRRCAAQSWPLDRVKAVKDAAGVSPSTTWCWRCAPALREYLDDNDALPDTPLVAMVPVSLRTDRDRSATLRAVLCNPGHPP